jgi:hypothetical protein
VLRTKKKRSKRCNCSANYKSMSGHAMSCPVDVQCGQTQRERDKKRGNTQYTRWAAKIADAFTAVELDQFTLALDGDVNGDFYQALNAINAERNPSTYQHVLPLRRRKEKHNG